MLLNDISAQIIGAAIAVHRAVGPGLLESTYEACMIYELRKRGLRVETQVPVPVFYDGQKLTDVGYRMDILVEGVVVAELKAVEAISPKHEAQLLSYLRHADLRLGLLLNFNMLEMRKGVHRVVNGYKE